jgi:hypothetical protein
MSASWHSKRIIHGRKQQEVREDQKREIESGWHDSKTVSDPTGEDQSSDLNPQFEVVQAIAPFLIPGEIDFNWNRKIADLIS